MNRTMWLVVAGLMATAGVVAGAAQIAALAGVTPGQWQLTEIAGTATKTVCIADPAHVLQIAHGDAQCSRTVIDSDAKAVTVQYTCPGAGSGRSTLTVRSPQSFKLETQGLMGGAPFAVDYDAKRIGDCPGGVAKPAKD